MDELDSVIAVGGGRVELAIPRDVWEEGFIGPGGKRWGWNAWNVVRESIRKLRIECLN